MPKIIVIGDVMLDKYDFCVNRENPESSAPCYTVEKTEYRPGGAGNVAANLASLGADFELIGIIGKDSASIELKRTLQDFKIPHKLLEDDTRQTIVKERTLSVSDGRYHYRKDRERKQYIEENHVGEILQMVGNPSLIIISDYAKGMISKKLMEELIRTKIPIFVDPKPAHLKFYSGVYLIKPNLKEVREMVLEQDGLKAAKKLSKELSTRVLLTKGAEGVIYTEEGREIILPGEKVDIVDVTGAGDSVMASFSHFFVKGFSLEECTRLANRAGAVAVSHIGCYQVKEEELLR